MAERKKRDKHLSVLLTKETRERFERLAAQEGRHLSGFGSWLIENGLDAYERQAAARREDAMA